MSQQLHKSGSDIQGLPARSSSPQAQSFRKALREWRIKNKMTQAQVGAIIESNRQQVCNWEKGNYVPSKLRYMMIVEKLGLDIPKYCIIKGCNEFGEPAHLITRANLPKEEWKTEGFLIYLCRKHHTEQHKTGIETFCTEHGLETLLERAKALKAMIK